MSPIYRRNCALSNNVLSCVDSKNKQTRCSRFVYPIVYGLVALPWYLTCRISNRSLLCCRFHRPWTLCQRVLINRLTLCCTFCGACSNDVTHCTCCCCCVGSSHDTITLTTTHDVTNHVANYRVAVSGMVIGEDECMLRRPVDFPNLLFIDDDVEDDVSWWDEGRK